MGDAAYFLDVMPGETRGIVVRNGRFHSLYIERPTDVAEHRLGARVVGRISRVEPGLGAAFVDLGAGEPFGFLSLGKNRRFAEGEKVTVEITAEPRESKGPSLRYVGEGQGEVRLISRGPSVSERIKALAGDQPILTGIEALEASLAAEEEALSSHVVVPAYGLDLSMERTRALIAADIDYAPLPGRDSRKAREAVNRVGMAEIARQLSLKAWGGIICVDLVGVNLHAESIMKMAKAAFADRNDVVFAPLSRFGVLQFSMPWTHQPVEERLAQGRAAGLTSLRELNRALLSDRSVPVFELVCPAAMETMLSPLVSELGPRARLVARTDISKPIVREA